MFIYVLCLGAIGAPDITLQTWSICSTNASLQRRFLDWVAFGNQEFKVPGRVSVYLFCTGFLRDLIIIAE